MNEPLQITAEEISADDLRHLAEHGYIKRKGMKACHMQDMRSEETLRHVVCELALKGLVAVVHRDALDLEGEERVRALLKMQVVEDTIRCHGPMHKARTLHRLVPWADWDAMMAKYVEARLRTERTGVEHVVDHIVPFQGKTVSGLHCEFNLQVITAAENQAKYNHFDG